MKDSGTFRHHLVAPTNIDAIGFRERRRGHEVRDCILVLEPGGKKRLVLLTRSEIGDTVVATTVRSGLGSINIDGCRIRSSGDHKRPFQPTANERNVYGKQTGFMPTNSEGRFPANLILVHGPSCRCEGVREIKTRSDTRPEDDAGRSSKREWRFTPTSETKRGYGGEDGVEEVANWVCEHGCPVAEMDRQSGNRPSNNCLASSGFKDNSPVYGVGLDSHRGAGYGDEGGASRFFKQVQGEGELDAYLNRLVRYDKA